MASKKEDPLLAYNEYRERILAELFDPKATGKYVSTTTKLFSTATPVFATPSPIFSSHAKTQRAPVVAVVYQSIIKPENIGGLVLERLSRLQSHCHVSCRSATSTQTDELVPVFASALGIPCTTYPTCSLPGVRAMSSLQRDKAMVLGCDAAIVYVDKKHWEEDGTKRAVGGVFNVLHELTVNDKTVEIYTVDEDGASELVADGHVVDFLDRMAPGSR
jgi:hypothetical protein